MASPGIAVTGAAGRLGGRVARRLASAGIAQRLLVRDPSRAPALNHTDVARAVFDDAEAVRRALDGVPVVLMVSASEVPGRVEVHRTFVDAAVAAGVEHLIYISFFAAAPDARFTLARDHWATEEHIRASDLRWTFLRDNLYLDFLPLMVGDDGVIRGPAGDGRMAAVAQDDIADVAVAVLRDPASHVDATYELTGPTAISFDDAAAALTAATGRTVTYHPETVEEAYASRAKYGAPDWQLDAWVSTYTAIANGELARVTEDVARVAEHPPLSLSDVAGRQDG